MVPEQRIYLEVHPYHDYYYKWKKRKDELERRDRWLENLDSR